MKYIYLAIFLVAMSWTWSISNATRGMPISDHREIENQIEKLITDSIKEAQPNVSDVVFQQSYTEVVKPAEEIHVHVRYIVVDSTSQGDTTQQNYKGTVILKSTDSQTWVVSGKNMSSPMIEFENGIRVSAKEQDPNDGAETTKPTGEAAEPEAGEQPKQSEEHR